MSHRESAAFFEKVQVSNAESSDQLRDQVSAISADPKVLAAMVYANRDVEPTLYKVYAQIIEKAMGKKKIVVPDDSQQAFNQLIRRNQFFAVLTVVMRIIKETDKVLSPYDVTTYLWSVHGVSCQEDTKTITYIKQSLRFTVPKSMGWPDFPANFQEGEDYSVLLSMTNNVRVSVLPFSYEMHEVVTIVYSTHKLMKPEARSQNQVMEPRDPNFLINYLPVGSNVFVGSTYNPRFIVGVKHLTLCGPVLAELLVATSGTVAARMYVGLYNHCLSYMDSSEHTPASYCKNVHTFFKAYLLVGKDAIMDAFRKRVMHKLGSNITKFAQLQMFTDQSRSVRGQDTGDISVLTRNDHLAGPHLPDACSTAEKWILPIMKVQNEKPPRVIYAGCHPGNALPMIHHRLSDYVEGAKRNRLIRRSVAAKEGSEKALSETEVRQMSELNLGEDTKMSPEIVFIDLDPCHRNDKYRWEQSDLLTYPLEDGDFVLSDIWSSGDGKVLKEFVEKLLKYVSRLHKGINPVTGKSWKGLFCIKVNLKIQGLTTEKIEEDPLPDGWDTFLDLLKSKIYLTKCGRPHNLEFFVSNFVVSKHKQYGSVAVSNVTEFKTAMQNWARWGILANYYRTVCFFFENPRPFVLSDTQDLPPEDFPVFTSKSVFAETTTAMNYVPAYKDLGDHRDTLDVILSKRRSLKPASSVSSGGESNRIAITNVNKVSSSRNQPAVKVERKEKDKRHSRRKKDKRSSRSSRSSSNDPPNSPKREPPQSESGDQPDPPRQEVKNDFFTAIARK